MWREDKKRRSGDADSPSRHDHVLVERDGDFGPGEGRGQ